MPKYCNDAILMMKLKRDADAARAAAHSDADTVAAAFAAVDDEVD